MDDPASQAEAQRQVIEYWDTVHPVAQMVAAFASASSLESHQAVYDHAHGLIVAITAVRTLSWQRFDAPDPHNG